MGTCPWPGIVQVNQYCGLINQYCGGHTVIWPPQYCIDKNKVTPEGAGRLSVPSRSVLHYMYIVKPR